MFLDHYNSYSLGALPWLLLLIKIDLNIRATELMHFSSVGFAIDLLPQDCLYKAGFLSRTQGLEFIQSVVLFVSNWQGS